MLDDTLHTLQEHIQEAMQSITHLDELRDLKAQFFGKKGHLTQLLRSLGNLPLSERSKAGQKIHAAKEYIETVFLEKETTMTQNIQSNASTYLDATLPGRSNYCGSAHPITQIQSWMRHYFIGKGFVMYDAPEIDDAENNFDHLNIPEWHPARSETDTFHVNTTAALLRTHTSNAQMRILKDPNFRTPLLERGQAIQVISMGRVYRRDWDSTHTPMFHQMEGFVVSTAANFLALHSFLREFLHCFFSRHQDMELRFRTSYFPFTEPSAEVDIQFLESGDDLHSDRRCGVAHQHNKPPVSGWLEILGCGMVHPDIIKRAGLDANRFRGYAFGMGLDRLAMLYYGIPDLRLLFDSDQRFLKQF